MRHDKQQPAGGQSRANLYQGVTDRVIAELEKGCVPWVRPWDQSKSGLAMPQNATTGRHYSGINVLILWDAVISRDFGAHRWLTLRQANAIGGQVRKGERGITVCYADRFIPKAEQQRAAEQGDNPSAVPFLKRFTVFNVEQCDGIPEAETAAAPLEPCQIVDLDRRAVRHDDPLPDDERPALSKGHDGIICSDKTRALWAE